MGTVMPGSRRTLRGNPIATLVAVCFGLFMVGLDATVVSIANPAIAADLGTTFTQLQWITNAYLLALAVFLILGGKLGDRFGRRRMYLVGVVAFALSSVAIGLVGTATGVIVFRALQASAPHCSCRRPSHCCGPRSRRSGSASRSASGAERPRWPSPQAPSSPGCSSPHSAGSRSSS